MISTFYANCPFKIPVPHRYAFRLQALGEGVDGRVSDVGRADDLFRTVKDEDGDGEKEADLVK